MLDRLNPTIAELSQAIEQEVEKCPAAERLMTHHGVGALTAPVFVLIIGKQSGFQCGKQITTYLGLCAQRVLDTGPTLSERDLSPVHRKRSGLLGFAINASVEVTWSN